MLTCIRFRLALCWDSAWGPRDQGSQTSDFRLEASVLPQPWGPDVQGQRVSGPSCVQRLQGRVLPASSSFWGSRRPSLGWWPPPSRLRLRLHVASPLCPCLSSSVSYEDPVVGFRVTPIQEEPHLRPFTPSPLQRFSFLTRCLSEVPGAIRRTYLFSKQSPIPGSRWTYLSGGHGCTHCSYKQSCSCKKDVGCYWVG